MTNKDVETVLAHSRELIHFTILGAPRTKKNHSRIIRAGARLRILPSVAHEKWYVAAYPQVFKAIANHRFDAFNKQVNCRALFYRDKITGDAVGYYQALGDLLERAGVVANDALIVSWDGSRLRKDKDNPRIEVVLEAIA